MTTPTWFLDVDGVINSWDTPHHKHGPYEVAHVPVLGVTYKIEYSPAVIDRINTIHTTGLAKVVWLTTWNDHAQSQLAPALGLRHFDVVPEPAPGTTNWSDKPYGPGLWWKTGRVLEHLAANPGAPYIWTDDLMFKQIKTALRAASDAPNLLMTIMRTPGLTPANLDRIEEFCREVAGA